MNPIASACAGFDPHAVVSFHALTTAQSRKAAGARPVGVVVTDLSSIHRLWLDRDADFIAVPTDYAAFRARALGLGDDQLAVTGLPVSSAFVPTEAAESDRAGARAELNLDERFTVLLTGGGEGVGALKQQAKAILRRNPGTVVAVICGKNRRLYRDIQRLSASFPNRVVCRGFVDNMSTWMRAADVVAANAGPGTITEALTLGAALVLTGSLPGQEQGNVKQVLDLDAGLYAKRPDQVAETVRQLHETPLLVEKLRAAARAAVKQDSTGSIARRLFELAETGRRQRPLDIAAFEQRREETRREASLV
jgi:UDP-N-acetylglucosamine:LPS N-acetylglucosamine transferase